jgi:transposase
MVCSANHCRAVDALGNLVDFKLMPGQAHDLVMTRELLANVCCQSLLADKAFDANWLRDFLAERSIVAVIPPKSNRKNPASCDMEVYKWRHLIENFFQKLKEFKRIAMRACKTDTSLEAMIHVRATVIRTR